MTASQTAEQVRLEEANRGVARWRRWGPYVSERAWGTVREDYSPGGDAWAGFPHDHARSRAYRWSEDGLAGICDEHQLLCFGLALWNGRDPILKERIFGLSGPEGNHGEDAKEQWWYLDSTPTHSWMRWRYAYPIDEFPYRRLVEENARRGKDDPEFELLDTGVFEVGYFEVTADYAKADPEDICIRITVRNLSPGPADLDLIPTLWFRNVWSWVDGPPRPRLAVGPKGALVAEHERLGRRVLSAAGRPELLFCENESNTARLWGQPNATPHPKDGINDHVVHGAPTVNPERHGTKAGLRYRLSLKAGRAAEIRLRLALQAADLGADFERVMADREAEANDFYQNLLPAHLSVDRAAIARQAFAGMLWSKQFFRYDVRAWLDGDAGQPAPPSQRLSGRNRRWRHLDAADVISMPDKWEYPWFAAWDLAFHAITLAHVDPELAKSQLILLCREWYVHPNGQLPAYEWDFDDVNPPVQAMAALRVFEIDGGTDYGFLERMFHKLLVNFTWWVNREDAEDNNLFEGGFLGLDNIGPFDRSAPLPVPGVVEQSDGTAWMATYCLNMLEMALTLAVRDDTYEDVATKFFEHFTLIARAMNEQGLWNEEDGFYYDALRTEDGERIPLPARSMVGLIPLCAVAVIERGALDRLAGFRRRMDDYLARNPDLNTVVRSFGPARGHSGRLLSVVSPDRLRKVLKVMLDETELLSPFGIRSLSRAHLDKPLVLELGGQSMQLDYEPAESRTGLFGGNSNWRGPVWFPVNFMLIESLRRFGGHLGADFRVECPTGSGRRLSLAEAADELGRRLISIFEEGPQGRPVFGARSQLQGDPQWHGLIPFYEYFNGDTGEGLGASHQTGWTGLVAELAMRSPRPQAGDGARPPVRTRTLAGAREVR